MEDFPTAHSMDTEWFAIDADGNLAIFWSGEDGAIPEKAKDYDLEKFLEYFPKDSKGIRHIPLLGSIVAEDLDLESLEKEIEFGGTLFDILLVLTSIEAIEELKFDTCLCFAGEPIIVWIDRCSHKIIKNLIDRGKIIQGKPDFNISSHAQILGFYTYNHSFGCPAPYKRSAIPLNSLKLTNIPERLQQKIQPIVFDRLHFNETQEIQPLEHMDCATWGSDNYWLDTKREREEWKDITEEDFAEYG